MLTEYNLRPLESRDAGCYYSMICSESKHTKGHILDVIKAFAGHVWGAFLPDGKLISK